MVTWGDAASGGDSLEVWDQLSDGVVDLSHTSSAFAARKADGSVVPGSKLCVCVCVSNISARSAKLLRNIS